MNNGDKLQAQAFKPRSHDPRQYLYGKKRNGGTEPLTGVLPEP